MLEGHDLPVVFKDIFWKQSSGKTQANRTRVSRGTWCCQGRPFRSCLLWASPCSPSPCPDHFSTSFCFFPLTLSPTLSHFSSWTCSNIHSHLTTSPLLPPSFPSCPSPHCPAPSNLLHAFSQPQYFLLYPLRGLIFFSDLPIWLGFCNCL